MKTELQLKHLKKEVDKLQKRYGNPNLNAIYGAGCISNPKFLFLFMNPTARNISSINGWKGIRAPWIGTKNIWKMLYNLEMVDFVTFSKIVGGNQKIWTEVFAHSVYDELNKNSVYITNLAKCTQDDARPLKDKIFKDYLKNTLEEIRMVNPNKIISFGNQVSSILLNKKIKVSDYKKHERENLDIEDKKFSVFPVYYPIGQGMKNMKKAINRIKHIINL